MNPSITLREDHGQGWHLSATSDAGTYTALLGFGYHRTEPFPNLYQPIIVRLQVLRPTAPTVFHEGRAGEARTKAEAMKLARAYIRAHGLRSQLRELATRFPR